MSGPFWGEAEAMKERLASWKAGGEPPHGYSDLRDTDQNEIVLGRSGQNPNKVSKRQGPVGSCGYP